MDQEDYESLPNKNDDYEVAALAHVDLNKYVKGGLYFINNFSLILYKFN